MRRSRVVFAGAAIAVIAITGTAFTAGNDLPDSVAGYGEAQVSGATVNDIAYTPYGSDNTDLGSVVFTSTTDITGQTATMTLKQGSTPVGTSPYTCLLGAHDGTSMTVTCATPDHPAFALFNTVGLTVVQ
jgi:hypothetical protein